MNAPIPEFSVGRADPHAMQEKLNLMVRAINTLLSMRGDGRFISISRAAGGGMMTSLMIDQVAAWMPKAQNQMYTAKLTSSISGRVGWYNAKLATSGANSSASGNLAETDITAAWATSENVLVQYVPDLGASAPSITDFTTTNLKNLIIVGLLCGTDAATNKPILEFTPSPGGSATLVRVTAAASGGGKYTGYVVNSPTAGSITASGNLADTDVGANGASCLILNMEEAGQSTHDLTATGNVAKVFPAAYRRMSGDATPIPVYAISGVGWKNCT